MVKIIIDLDFYDLLIALKSIVPNRNIFPILDFENIYETDFENKKIIPLNKVEIEIPDENIIFN